MVNERAARRHLTIDVELPRDEGASLPWRDGERMYVVPLAVRRKRPETSHVDLVDENDRSLAVLTRRENAQITRRALQVAVDDLIDPSPQTRKRLNRYLDALVHRKADRYERSAYVASAVSLLKLVYHGDARTDAKFMRMHQLLRDVATNTILWTVVTGYPGQRRIVKFSYDIPLVRASLWPRKRAGWRRRSVFLVGDDELLFDDFDRGDGNEQGIVRRTWNRIATTIGWAAYDIQIDSPYVRGAESYHLQFRSPPGVETRSIRLGSMLVNNKDAPQYPVVVPGREHSHLHFSGLRVKRDGPIEISVRVGRRGYLSYCTLAACVIAAMLWAFSEFHADAVEQPEVSAATLLLVPALLAAFVVRQDEHILVSQLLAGVRTALFICGVLSAAAASAIAGVVPLGFADTADAWHWYAVAATGLAAVLILSWMLAWDSVERVRRASHRLAAEYRRYGVIAFTIGISGAAVMHATPAHAGRDAMHLAAVAVVLAVGLAAGWWAQFADANRLHAAPLQVRRLICGVLVFDAVLLVVGAALLGGWDADILDWEALRGWFLSLAILAPIVIAGLEGLRRANHIRSSKVLGPIEEDEEPWIVDYAEHDSDAGADPDAGDRRGAVQHSSAPLQRRESSADD